MDGDDVWRRLAESWAELPLFGEDCPGCGLRLPAPVEIRPARFVQRCGECGLVRILCDDEGGESA